MESKQRVNPISFHSKYLIFVIAIVFWCSLIVAAPLLASREHRLSSGLIYLFFSKICHQIPERSFFIFGKQFAVCSRCTGLYLGFLIGAILYPVVFKLNRVRSPAPKYLLLAAIPIMIDILVRTIRIADNSSASRLVTGMILGATAVLFVIPGILSLNFKKEFDLKGARYGGTTR